jgi:hypothetical protein
MRIRPEDAFLPLDVVETGFGGKITRHIVVERFKSRGCESGVTYRLVPTVPKSGGKDSKIDHNWFRRIGRIEMTADKKIIYVEAK